MQNTQHFQPLIGVIVSTTGGQDNGGLWQDEGGLGTVEEFTFGAGDARRVGLVIRQTEDVHRQISDLLADLRALPAAEPDGDRITWLQPSLQHPFAPTRSVSEARGAAAGTRPRLRAKPVAASLTRRVGVGSLLT